MAHFYGRLRAAQHEGTRLGTKASGLEALATGEAGGILVTLSHREGQDWAVVEFIEWRGQGMHQLLYSGPWPTERDAPS